MTPHGGIVISPGDLNPERMVIDDEWLKSGPPAMPAVNVGDTFPGPHVGDHGLRPSATSGSSCATSPSIGVHRRPRVRESAVAAGTDKVSIATFNVENLDPERARREVQHARRDDREQPRSAGHRRPRGDPGQQRRDRRHQQPGRRRGRDARPPHRRDPGGRRPDLRVPADRPGRSTRTAASRAATSASASSSERIAASRSSTVRAATRRRRSRSSSGPDGPAALREPGTRRRLTDAAWNSQPQAAGGRVHLQRPASCS